MGHQSVTLPTAGGECGTIFLAIELSRQSWLVALRGPLSEKVSLHRLGAGDWRGVLQLIDRQRDKAERALGRSIDVVSCYEAGYDGFWLHRRLSASGIASHVMDPASLLVNRRARRAKTDRIDVRHLLRAVIAWRRGEIEVCKMVHVPSVEQEDERRPHRERGRLVSERTSHTNRINGLLATQGIYNAKPRRRDFVARLEWLVTGDGGPLPPDVRAEIGRELERLVLVERHIAALETTRDRALQVAAPLGTNAAKKQQLARLKSIANTTATELVGEVFYRDFKNRRQVGAYGGLTGSPFNSGATTREQGLSKAGNPRVRTAMVELAWRWRRYQPQSALSQWFERRLNGAKGRLKRILIVALARKLLIALWRYLETGLIPEGAVLKY